MTREGVLIPTEPGSAPARAYGCTCPEQTAEQTTGGGVHYTRAEDCPLHRLPHSAPTPALHEHGRRVEALRERERNR